MHAAQLGIEKRGASVILNGPNPKDVTIFIAAARPLCYHLPFTIHMSDNVASDSSSRRTAIRVLARWLRSNDFPDRIIPDCPDRGFVMDLVYGAVRQRRAIEWMLARHVDKMPAGETLAALLAGACQLFFMPSVPDYAAVDATVEAAKQASKRSAGFVNAVLRTLLRNREALTAELASQPLAVRLSHPDALVTRWLDFFGEKETTALCEWNNRPAETVVSLLPHSGLTAAAWMERLAATPDGNGLNARPHPAAPDTAVTLPHGAPRIETLPGFTEGWFVVQDPATRAAVDLLDVRPGQRILDACAAPGGKTLQIASRLLAATRGAPPPGELVAMDLHQDRLVFLQENLARAGMAWVRAIQGDASALTPEAAGGLFDRVLLDAPCANTGVLRRRPDARWRFTAHRLQTLVHTQRTLLANAIRLLAPGGILVYSTCSLEPEENQRQMERLCLASSGLRLLGAETRHPVRQGTDGAYAVALQRP